MTQPNVEYRTGDLLAQPLPAYAHGVNCAGLMGAGIAALFRHRWPAMYTEYRTRCQGRLCLGDIHAWTAPDGTVVYNLATQPRPGACASLDAIRGAVTSCLADAGRRGLAAVGMPRIGAGIGGLAWPDVDAVIRQVACGPVRLVVVSLPTRAAR